jgi:pimeloyl-ACP methyl ester carboxylesterase
MNLLYICRLISFLITLSLCLSGCNEDSKTHTNTNAQEVSYAGGDVQTTLAGTLSLPKGDGPFPAVLLISGSGDNDRDETLGPLKPFSVLAEALNKQGYAVLRYDDRGTARSTGDYSSATLDDFAADAVAGMRYLRGNKRIDQNCLILAGHSEGSHIATLAAETIRPEAIVFLAGAAHTMSDVLLTQLQTLNHPDEDPLQIAKLLEIVNSIVADATDMTLAAKEINTLLEAEGIAQEERSNLISPLATAWWKRYLSFEPSEHLSRLDMPVLALYGDKDTQVRAVDNASLMQSFLQNPTSQVDVLPGMNHLFQQAKTGLPDEYFTLPKVFEAAMRDRMIAWLKGALPAQCAYHTK